jgi:hypothetical protein
MSDEIKRNYAAQTFSPTRSSPASLQFLATVHSLLQDLLFEQQKCELTLHLAAIVPFSRFKSWKI